MGLHPRIARRSRLVLLGVIGGGLLWLAWRELPSALGAREPPPAPPTAERVTRVGALGRIRPRHGVIRVAGPPRPTVVIGRLLVEKGESVRKGQPLAVLAGIRLQRAEVARLRAQAANARRELQRKRTLFQRGVLSDSAWEAVRLAEKVASAQLARAEADLALSTVRAPIDGVVLDVHAREGELVGPEGIAELADTSVMYVRAEIYETDVGRVRVGQPAEVRSPALPRALHGEVERVGLKVERQDVLTTDPVADADARVVEAEIRLDEPELAAHFTNLRVDVVLGK